MKSPTAEQIVYQLAADDPIVEWDTGAEFCRYCGQKWNGEIEHLRICVFRMAREWVAEQDARPVPADTQEGT